MTVCFLAAPRAYDVIMRMVESGGRAIHMLVALFRVKIVAYHR